MNINLLITSCAAAFTLMLPLPGSANAEDALYGARLPEDAVFIRWLAPTVSAKAFGADFDAEVSNTREYVPVSNAVLDGAEAGRFYSLIGDQIIPEPPRDDATKVHLVLLNADSTPARLIVSANETEVIGATTAGQARSRGVNPVQAELSVVTDAGPLATFDLSLRRGQNLTFVVVGDTVTLIENKFAPVVSAN
ncbi:hypothetical protein [Roseobacter sp. MH60115]|uniref:hypothetical protein n=1 Tax=Roseobacter sp. MH60115 TaxID=2785324 RepID=UPI0018A2785F|nr:hypothetical protein [Roseobacter sp. MH60115]